MSELSVQAQVAKLIRQELKTRGIVAKVKSEKASMMTSVVVTLQDCKPEIRKEVESFVKGFQAGKFDSQTDTYVYAENKDHLPRVKYTSVNVDFSDDLRQKALDVMRAELPDDENLNYDSLIIGKIPETLDRLRNEQSRLIYRICMGSDPEQLLSSKLWS